jgi:phage terminase large subunit-like protein
MTTPIWTTACPDWQRRIVAGESLVPCPPLFPDEAEHALSIFKQLRIYNLPGQPTMGEACREWVFDIVRAVFGAYDPGPGHGGTVENAGRRMIVEFFLHVSKKNSKSFIAAAIMLTATILNWRNGGEFNIIAPTIEVASNSYTPAMWMVKLDPELDDLFHYQPHLKTITNRDNGTILKVVAADKNTVAGKIGTITLLDEFWLFGENPHAENMLIEATGGLASRPEGCVIYLTTQSDRAPAGVFRKKLQYARDVRDGKIDDPAFMPILYEFPEQMVKDKAYMKPENFYITNPNLGLSVDIPFIERKFKQAEADGEESLCGFLAKHLNVEIGMVMRSERWAGADCWEKAAIRVNEEIVGWRHNSQPGLTLEMILERSDVITIGADGGGLDDLLGQCILGRDREDHDLWRAWFGAWVHPIALERRKTEAPMYRDLAVAGELTIINEIGQDVQEFCDRIDRCEASELLERIGVDPSGIAEPVNELKLREYEEDRIVSVSQGWRLTSSIKDTERKLAAGKLHHNGGALMKWCVSNARVEPKGNAILVTKAASGTGKIDPVMALFNAVALMVLNPAPRGTAKHQLFFV